MVLIIPVHKDHKGCWRSTGISKTNDIANDLKFPKMNFEETHLHQKNHPYLLASARAFLPTPSMTRCSKRTTGAWLWRTPRRWSTRTAGAPSAVCWRRPPGSLNSPALASLQGRPTPPHRWPVGMGWIARQLWILIGWKKKHPKGWWYHDDHEKWWFHPLDMSYIHPELGLGLKRHVTGDFIIN